MQLSSPPRIAPCASSEPEPRRPPGGWRTKRCECGYRCDNDEWLCEVCQPKTIAEKLARYKVLLLSCPAEAMIFARKHDELGVAATKEQVRYRDVVIREVRANPEVTISAIMATIKERLGVVPNKKNVSIIRSKVLKGLI